MGGNVSLIDGHIDELEAEQDNGNGEKMVKMNDKKIFNSDLLNSCCVVSKKKPCSGFHACNAGRISTPRFGCRDRN